MKPNNLVFVILIVVFFGFGFFALKSALPSPKEERIYSLIQQEMPYTLEKRVGGFSIVFKNGDEKLKPSNEEVFKMVETIDKNWGKTHLKVTNNSVQILDDSQNIIKTIALETQKEKEFVISYFFEGISTGDIK
ncbi:MAG: hypothetical protein M0P43_01710 [Arcobacteraceae bacterium]|nr:hypothetical protein [Arcobacteraceae bacterium]